MTEVLIKVLSICLICALICLIFEKNAREYSLIISLAGGIISALLLFGYLVSPIRQLSDELKNYGVNTSYFAIALKAVGIGYIVTFIADTCRDCGQSSLASKAEFAGKCAIFLLICPLLVTLMETAVGFLK